MPSAHHHPRGAHRIAWFTIAELILIVAAIAVFIAVLGGPGAGP